MSKSILCRGFRSHPDPVAVPGPDQGWDDRRLPRGEHLLCRQAQVQTPGADHAYVGDAAAAVLEHKAVEYRFLDIIMNSVSLLVLEIDPRSDLLMNTHLVEQTLLVDTVLPW